MTTATTPAPAAPAAAPAAAASPAPSKPQPGTPEWDKAMIDKFDSKNVVPDPNADKPAQVPPKPEGVPDKFYDPKTGAVDVVGLAKSYTEIERTRSDAAKAAKDAADKAAADAKALATKAHTDGRAKLEADLAAVKAKQGATPEEIAKAEKALADYPAAPKEAAQAPQAQAKADFAKIDEEFASTGKLSDESYKALEEAGFDRARVDLHMRGMQALQREYNAKAYTLAGGETQYKAMIEWAKTGATQAEAQAFDAAVQSGDEAAMSLAVQGLSAKFTAANGKQPTLAGGTRPDATAGGFRSTAEMTAAMKDPRYKNDPAYRADVERRVANAAF